MAVAQLMILIPAGALLRRQGTRVHAPQFHQATLGRCDFCFYPGSTFAHSCIIVGIQRAVNGCLFKRGRDRLSDIRKILKEMNISQAGHLPVVAAFLERMGLADAVNAAAPTEMVVDVGTVVQFMVLDTLSGRSPLYRLEKFAESVDTGLLLGRKIPTGAFNDTTLGRAMDAIYDAGT